MKNRERALAILNYENYDRMPVVHFGFLMQTIQKWRNEGHITEYDDNASTAKKLGFDFDWFNTYTPNTGLMPWFERQVLEEYPDGMQKVMNGDGAIILVKPGVHSIPAEVDHLLKDRKSWEKHYLHRLQFSEERIDKEAAEKIIAEQENRDEPLGIHCGSLFGQIRNWMGITGVSYLYADDFELYKEIIDTVGSLCYNITEAVLKLGIKFDFAHFWEDICFRNGPLVIPSVFRKLAGPHYKRITELVNSYGISIVSLDCDGCIDTLVPIWLENGVNTMFPIEVGIWGGNIKTWRDMYGKEIRGVGGMNKHVFAEDYEAVDREIERLKPLVDLGGYIPCPDHRIPPTAKWENVQYYCDRMRKVFG